jgi:acyl carrier protein
VTRASSPDLQVLIAQVRTIAIPVLPPDKRESFGDDDDLLNVLDSLHLLRLVMALENHFAVKVDHAEMTAENLRSISRLASLMAQKCKNPIP